MGSCLSAKAAWLLRTDNFLGKLIWPRQGEVWYGSKCVGGYEIAGQTLWMFYPSESKNALISGSDAEFAARLCLNWYEAGKQIESAAALNLAFTNDRLDDCRFSEILCPFRHHCARLLAVLHLH